MDDTAWLRALQTQWRLENHTLFGSGLRPVAMRLDDSRTQFASWELAPRTITVSRRLLTHPWPVVVEVLKHEMAHQYAHEVLQATDETAHGPAFRRTCAERGIDSTAAGTPETDQPESRVLDRIRKLMALAESPEQHEAEAATRRAQRMMLEHHLELSDLDERPYHARHVGRVSTRFMAHERWLAGLLGRYFFVHCIWVTARMPDGRRARMLEICGHSEDLEVAVHVHAWLTATAERLWKAHKKSGKATPRGRGRFLAGVVKGFSEQCAAEEKACEETGLVRVNDPALRDFMGRRHPRTRSTRGRGVRADSSFEAGRREGLRAKLRRGLRRDGTRLLNG
ncbi:MAG: DUF2786 domain-containing protein [Proteobacteria bacterium]|nr:DUF2786 domain-containing protein [Pseudomonadota bacterium]